MSLPERSGGRWVAGDAIARFWSKVEKTSYCWHWTAPPTQGYGRFFIDGRRVAAHRFAYEVSVGPIPDGLVLDHLCRNTTCVRPDHLEPVTQQVNLLRGRTVNAAGKAKTHCPHGHPYDEANTIVRRNRDGSVARQCRICKAIYQAAYQRRRRAARRREEAA